jgi:hypothetical protein
MWAQDDLTCDLFPAKEGSVEAVLSPNEFKIPDLPFFLVRVECNLKLDLVLVREDIVSVLLIVDPWDSLLPPRVR